MAFRKTNSEEIIIEIPALSSDEKGKGVILDDARVEQIMKEVLRLIVLGYTQKAICKAIGASRSRVSRWSRDAVFSYDGPTNRIVHRNSEFNRVIFDRIDFRSKDECWNWIGAVKPTGYGSINHNGKAHQAHRAVYELMVGEPEFELDHKCENKRCVNPWHLQDVNRSVNQYLIYARKDRKVG